MRRWACMALAAASLASCGVPTHDHASRAAPDKVPFGLLDGSAQLPVPGPPTSPQEGDPIYLLDEDDRLIETRRDTSGDLEDIVAAVLAGPSEDEGRLGLHTALSDTTAVESVTLSGGVAAVDFAPVFADLDGDTQRRAIAQIVYTLTAQPGVGRVAITLDGEDVEFPRGDGTLTSGTVSRDGYAELAPRPQ